MSYRLPIERPDVFTAVAVLDMNLAADSECSAPSAPVLILICNGTADPLASWHGGPVAEGDRGSVVSATETLAARLGADRAGPQPVETVPLPDLDPNDLCTVGLDRHVTIDGGAEVRFYTVAGGGHTMPSVGCPIPPLLLSLAGVGRQAHASRGERGVAVPLAPTQDDVPRSPNPHRWRQGRLARRARWTSERGPGRRSGSRGGVLTGPGGRRALMRRGAAIALAAFVLVAEASAQEVKPAPTAPQSATPVPATASEATARDRGLAAFKAHRFGEAKLLLGKAVALAPDDAESQATLGFVLYAADGDLDGAAAHLETAIRLAPDSSRYHEWLGMVATAQAQSTGAMGAAAVARRAGRELERAVQLAPRDVDARMTLLQFYLGAPEDVGGSVEKATEEAIAITGIDRYRGLEAQAFVAEHERDMGRAERLYRTAIAASPESGDAYNQLGYLLLRTKRRAEALTTFRSYVAVAPGEANPHDSLAEALLAAGKVDESIEQYRKALAIDPGFASSWLGLANCYEKKADWQAERDALRRFVGIAPNGARADAARDRLDALASKRR
jgi:tetratricopeptide (TPR) repeat protein